MSEPIYKEIETKYKVADIIRNVDSECIYMIESIEVGIGGGYYHWVDLGDNSRGRNRVLDVDWSEKVEKVA